MGLKENKAVKDAVRGRIRNRRFGSGFKARISSLRQALQDSGRPVPDGVRYSDPGINPGDPEEPPRSDPQPAPREELPAPEAQSAPESNDLLEQLMAVQALPDNSMHRDKTLIPVEPGAAVGKGWKRAGGAPTSVTWHWSATWDLATLDKIIGGSNPIRRGQASAHYGIGTGPAEGVSLYVELDNRSWHAGVNQTLNWKGEERGGYQKGATVSIGIEVAHVGFERKGIPAESDWITVYSTHGRSEMKVPPWPVEQQKLMVAVGKQILQKYPHLKPEDHHGHRDICPGYKEDPAGMPWANILRGIYGDPTIPDIWTPFHGIFGRQHALRLLGYDIGSTGPRKDGVDGDWGRLSDAALLRLQADHGLVENGHWTVFVSRKVYEVFRERGIPFENLQTKGQ